MWLTEFASGWNYLRRPNRKTMVSLYRSLELLIFQERLATLNFTHLPLPSLPAKVTTLRVGNKLHLASATWGSGLHFSVEFAAIPFHVENCPGSCSREYGGCKAFRNNTNDSVFAKLCFARCRFSERSTQYRSRYRP